MRMPAVADDGMVQASTRWPRRTGVGLSPADGTNPAVVFVTEVADDCWADRWLRRHGSSRT
ncbi:hypothetical protein [Dactylosporangium fulvum]|uniref:Uncharacterized protein n=1 Tax=Dactylosporangium fulvum TaxID=53359 RepID=A0ABY5VXL5_9ACTN|nr:hypothetical protein [Dactylosporangium fulvum]UWP82457.1 hypothetical protein Dfulv_46715 [Dactylosporangium fulvum]